MKGPAKRTSEIFNKIRSQRDPVRYKQTRGKMWLAAKIAEGIINKGWSKIEFARLIDQTPSTVSRWLSGHHNFTVDTLNEIEDILGIDLLNWDKKKFEGDNIIDGTMVSSTAVNIFITGADYFTISDGGNVLLELSENSDNVQVLKNCDPILN